MDYRHGWQSQQLMIKPIGDGNRVEAETIYREFLAWREERGMLTPSFENFVNKKDLPPDGDQEDFTIFVARVKEGREAVGLLALLDKWPDERTLYIAMYYIPSEHQSNGYGSEIMDSLMSMARADRRQLSIRVHQISTMPPRFFYDRGFEVKETIEPDDAILIKKR